MKRVAAIVIGAVVVGSATMGALGACNMEPISMSANCADDFACPSKSTGGAGGEGAGGSGASGGAGGSGGVACMPPIPDGWTGYYSFTEEPFAAPTKPCPDGLKPSIYFFNASEHPGCKTKLDISCNAPQIRCGAIDLGNTNDCAPGLVIAPGVLDYTKCFDSTEATSTSVFDELRKQLLTNCETLDSGTLEGCVCTSMLDLVASQPWKNQAAICPLSESSDSSCVGKPNSPALLCILHPGTEECPAGLTQHVVFGEYKDERACSACTCTNPTCLNGSYNIHNALGCMDQTVKQLDYKCADKASLGILANGDWSIKPIAPQASGSASGGTPIGNVIGMGEVTFCCAQP